MLPSNSMKQVQVTIPNEPEDRITSILKILKEDIKIKNMILLPGSKNSLLIFRCESDALPDILKYLSKIGIGTSFGIIDVLDLVLTLPEESVIKTDKPEIEKRVSSEEIQKSLYKSLESSFNYVLFIILAALTAGSGLLLSSTTIVIASMIISPLMAPILCVAFGISVLNRKMIKRGMLLQLYGFLIALGIGLVLGYGHQVFGLSDDPTREMLLRYYPGILDFIIALAAGIAVGFSLTNVMESSIVGIAIAASLLPPVVNVGLAIGYGYYDLALGSFVLYIMNFFVINISTILVFKIKKIQNSYIPIMEWEGIQEEEITPKKKSSRKKKK
jgi:uncharacterized hydrophobic protein (TIGR00271 family)